MERGDTIVIVVVVAVFSVFGALLGQAFVSMV